MPKNKLSKLLGAIGSMPSYYPGVGATNSIGNKFEGGNINNKVANNKNDPKDDSEDFLEKNLSPLYYDFY